MEQYQAAGLLVSLYDDHLEWKSHNLTQLDKFTIYYSSIISVAYSNGGTFGEAYIEINTPGKIYRYSPNVGGIGIGGRLDFETMASAIQQKLDQYRSTSNPAPAATLNTNALTETLEKEIKQIQTENNDEQRANHFLPIHVIYINPNDIDPTLLRIQLLLEDKEWDRAILYCDAAMDYFPNDYRLYQYALFAENRVTDFDELRANGFSDEHHNYEKVIRFGDENIQKQYFDIQTRGKAIRNSTEEKQEVESDISKWEHRKQKKEAKIDDSQKESRYKVATNLMMSMSYARALTILKTLGDYKDSRELIRQCEKEINRQI